ncbi:MAG: tetrahydrofolate synthase [Flavobacteriales bacterium]|nr:tetrahydrofolate synthase [Flavobacteriales bacterium]
MKYQQTLDYLYKRLPIYQRVGKIAYKHDIGNIITASRKIHNPHLKFKSIHIAGTNGKGSVCHMLSSILQEAKYKVGLYTSPHLKDFRERIKINGEMIAKKEVIKFVSKNKISFENINLSFFEFTVALAFNYFAMQKVDIAIIETGLGGRLDSTNIIHPDLSVITNIGLDHTNLLGNTIEKIAKEKGGIIKKGTPVIIGRKQKELTNIFQIICDNKKTKIKYANSYNYKSDLKGNYQKENINTVISATIELKKQGWRITENNIKTGLLNTIKNTGIFGRWQILCKKPLVICDSAHNEDGIQQIFKQIRATPYKTLHIVFGIVDGKKTNNILEIIPKNAIYYFCKPAVIRGVNEKKLQKKAHKKGIIGNTYTSVKKAFSAAKRQAKYEDLIFIGGSTFVVAEVI